MEEQGRKDVEAPSQNMRRREEQSMGVHATPQKYVSTLV